MAVTFIKRGKANSLAVAPAPVQTQKVLPRLKRLNAITSMAQARTVIAAWVADYNTARPHSALGYQTPAAHAAKLKAMGPVSPPLRGSEPGPIAQTAPHGVTSPKALLTAG